MRGPTLEQAGQLACFPQLATLDLSGSGFGGPLPLEWLDAAFRGGQLSELRLRGNALEYPSGGASGQLLAQLVIECMGVGASVLCEGLPPTSCDAFGADFRLAASDATRCVRCEPGSFVPAVVGISVLTLVLVGSIALYIYLVRRYVGKEKKASLRKGVSTVAILIAHMQTVSIVGYLRLAWPPSVVTITGAAGRTPAEPEPAASQASAPAATNCLAMLITALGSISPSSVQPNAVAQPASKVTFLPVSSDF